MNFKMLIKKVFSLFRKKKPYEKVPFRTRVRMYIRALVVRSHGKISYEKVRSIILLKFGTDIRHDLDIYPEDVTKLARYKSVFVSHKDVLYDK